MCFFLTQRCVYKNFIVKNLSNDIRTEKPVNSLIGY